MFTLLYTYITKYIFGFTSFDTYELVKSINDDYEILIQSNIYKHITQLLNKRINSPDVLVMDQTQERIVTVKDVLLEKLNSLKPNLNLDNLVTFIIENNILINSRDTALNSIVIDKYRLYGYLYKNNYRQLIVKLQHSNNDVVILALTKFYTDYIYSIVEKGINIYKEALSPLKEQLHREHIMGTDNDIMFNIRSISTYLRDTKASYINDIKKLERI